MEIRLLYWIHTGPSFAVSFFIGKGRCLYVNPILHTLFRDSCFTCDGSPTIQVFPLIFYIGMVI
jgi:hypothetical protein